MQRLTALFGLPVGVAAMCLAGPSCWFVMTRACRLRLPLRRLRVRSPRFHLVLLVGTRRGLLPGLARQAQRPTHRLYTRCVLWASCCVCLLLPQRRRCSLPWNFQAACAMPLVPMASLRFLSIFANATSGACITVATSAMLSMSPHGTPSISSRAVINSCARTTNVCRSRSVMAALFGAVRWCSGAFVAPTRLSLLSSRLTPSSTMISSCLRCASMSFARRS